MNIESEATYSFFLQVMAQKLGLDSKLALLISKVWRKAEAHAHQIEESEKLKKRWWTKGILMRIICEKLSN